MQVIAGFGFRGSAGLDSLRDALHRTAQSHRLTALATPADKAEAACLRALANAALAFTNVRVPRENLLGGGGGGHHRHPAAGIHEASQDVMLHAKVDGDNVEVTLDRGGYSPFAGAFTPLIRLGGRHA